MNSKNNPIQWTYRDTRDSIFATFTVGNLKCVVQDQDGDASVWRIMEDDKVIAESAGSIYDGGEGPYHFELAKLQAAEALIVEATKRGLYRA